MEDGKACVEPERPAEDRHRLLGYVTPANVDRLQTGRFTDQFGTSLPTDENMELIEPIHSITPSSAYTVTSSPATLAALCSYFEICSAFPRIRSIPSYHTR